MAIDLYLDASALRVANYLRSLQPDGDLASWEVESYQVFPRIVGTAIRLSILAGLRRPGEADLLMAQVLLQELDTDRCMLSLRTNPTLTTTAEGEEVAAHGWEPEIAALFAWLLNKARRAWPEIDGQLEELDKKLGAGAVIRDWQPGPVSPELQQKLDIWNGWLKAHKRGISQERYCAQLDPPITPRTLRNYRDNLRRAGLIG